MDKPGRRTPLQSLVETKVGRELEALLRELYLEKRASDQEIATSLSEKVGLEVSRATVRSWREQFEISADDRPTIAI